MKDPEFCKRLRALRQRKGLTHNSLGARCNLPASLVSYYEDGTRQPGLADLKALIRGLGCSADELLGA